MMLLPLDSETTGLDAATDTILEIGWGLAEMDYTPITGPLQIAGGWEVAQFGLQYFDLQPFNRILIDVPNLEARIAAMDPYVRNMHEESGLLAELRDPALQRLPIETADTLIAGAIDAVLAQRQRGEERREQVKIAGSGVGYDRAMIEGTIASTVAPHMPLLNARLAYGLHDTSTLRDFMMRTLGVPQQTTYPARAHRGEDDIRDHIEEADAYRRILAAALGDEANIARLVREHGRPGYRGIPGE